MNGANGMACLNLRKFIDNPTKQYIAANKYEKPTANNVPIGPSQRASIATSFESPLPIASFLKINLATFLKTSKIIKHIKEVLNPLNIIAISINWLLEILRNINPKKPDINPKFISPWGIQKQSISIKAIAIRSDRKVQLKNKLKNKFELDANNEGELFVKITKRAPVQSSIKKYLEEIFVLQVLHFRPCINQLNKGIFSRQVNLVLHFGQKLLGLKIDKSLGKR